jgi:hypothetical protein
MMVGPEVAAIAKAQNRTLCELMISFSSSTLVFSESRFSASNLDRQDWSSSCSVAICEAKDEG